MDHLALVAVDEQHTKGVGLADDHLEVDPKGHLDLGPGRVDAGDGLGEGVEQLLSRLGDDLAIEVALGLEVLVEDRLGEARFLGDLVHRGRLEAPLGEDSTGHQQELLASLAVLGPIVVQYHEPKDY